MIGGTDDRVIVLAALRQADLHPAPEEVERLVLGYRPARQVADLLYDVPEVRYQDPAISFDPRTPKP